MRIYSRIQQLNLMTSIIFFFILVPLIGLLLIGLNLLLVSFNAYYLLLALPLLRSTGISLDSLPKNKVCVFSEDKNTLLYEFDSEAEAAKFLTPKKVAHLSDDDLKQNKNLQHIRRVINKAVLTNTEKGKFFIFKNPGYSSNLALVVWGKNLTSQVGNPRFSNEINNMIKLSPYAHSVCVGIILSDAWIEFAQSHSINARLGFKQSISHSDYLMFVFNLLSHYCSNYPHINKINLKGKLFHALQFSTRALPCFTELHNKFYVDGVKIIPKDIYNLLTPAALAHMIMGDGAANPNGGLFIYTNAFSLKNVINLINVLMIRYGLICSVHLKQSRNKIEPQVYISERSMPLLRSIVSPHFHSSMLYKLGIRSPEVPNGVVVQQAGLSSIIFFLILCPAIALLLILLNLLLAPHKPYLEKASAFECGFHSFLGQNRQQFSISFFLFGLLFLIFDLEIILIYPYVVSGNHNYSYGLMVVFTFLLILTVGFCYEIAKKALNINSKQSNNSITHSGSVLKSNYELIKSINKNINNIS